MPEPPSSEGGLKRGIVTFNLGLNKFTSGGWPQIDVLPFPSPEMMDIFEALGLEFGVEMGTPLFLSSSGRVQFKRLGPVDFDQVVLASRTGYAAQVAANPGEVYLAVTEDEHYIKFKVDRLDVPAELHDSGQVVLDFVFQSDGSRNLATHPAAPGRAAPPAESSSGGGLKQGTVTLNLSLDGFTPGGWPEVSVIPFPEAQVLDIFESSGIEFQVHMNEPFFANRMGQARLRQLGPVDLEQVVTAFPSGYQSRVPAAAGHAYLAITEDGYYCKLKVTALDVPTQLGESGRIVFDLVVQTDGSLSFR